MDFELNVSLVTSMINLFIEDNHLVILMCLLDLYYYTNIIELITLATRLLYQCTSRDNVTLLHSGKTLPQRQKSTQKALLQQKMAISSHKCLKKIDLNHHKYRQ
ncbi:hypothetical protein FORC73_1033 [Vibrio cholerae]|nr:hypothetical protein FORC73_1033 [Vibrio cholerae]